MTSSQRYKAALKSGLCGGCKKRPRRLKEGKLLSTCEVCNASTMRSLRTRYKLLRGKGMCTQCKRKEAVPEHARCEICGEAARARSAKYMANKRNKQPLAETRKAKRDAKKLV